MEAKEVCQKSFHKLISEVTVHYFYHILCIRSKSQGQPTLCGRELHSSVNTGRQESLMAILKAACHIYFSVCFLIKHSIIKNPYGDSSGTSGSKQFPYCGNLMLRSPLPWPGFVCPVASIIRPIRRIKQIFSNRPCALKPPSISPHCSPM